MKIATWKGLYSGWFFKLLTLKKIEFHNDTAETLRESAWGLSGLPGLRPEANDFMETSADPSSKRQELTTKDRMMH